MCSLFLLRGSPVLLLRLRAGNVELRPTDKNYKVYLHNLGGEKFKCKYKIPKQGVLGEVTYEWTIDESDHSKFYFQHFSKEQQLEFIGLLSSEKLKFGYPGYFYRLPFFIKYKEEC